MQYLTDPFVIFEFSLMLGAPLLILAALVAELVLLRRGLWRGGLIAVAALNGVTFGLWLVLVGGNTVGGGWGPASAAPLLASGMVLLAMLVALPVMNAAFLVAYAIVTRGRSEIGSSGTPNEDATGPAPTNVSHA